MKLFSFGTTGAKRICALLALLMMISVAFTGCHQTQKLAPLLTEVETTKKRGSEARGSDKDYIECNVIDLFNVLNVNVLKARKAYKNARVKVSGYVVSVDNGLNYVNIGAKSDDYEHVLSSMKCNIVDDMNRARVPGLARDDHVTIKGQIISVNEFLGYTMNVESIVLSAPKDGE